MLPTDCRFLHNHMSFKIPEGMEPAEMEGVDSERRVEAVAETEQVEANKEDGVEGADGADGADEAEESGDEPEDDAAAMADHAEEEHEGEESIDMESDEEEYEGEEIIDMESDEESFVVSVREIGALKESVAQLMESRNLAEERAELAAAEVVALRAQVEAAQQAAMEKPAQEALRTSAYEAVSREHAAKEEVEALAQRMKDQMAAMEKVHAAMQAQLEEEKRYELKGRRFSRRTKVSAKASSPSMPFIATKLLSSSIKKAKRFLKRADKGTVSYSICSSE